MATIHNSNLSNELRDGAKIQISKDKIPNELAEKVVPVMEVNPKLLRRCNIIRSGSASNATSGVIYTTPTDKDFYLVAAQMTIVKDNTSTSVRSSMYAIIDEGVAGGYPIMSICTTTLTAESGLSSSISFPIPILLKRGSQILLTNTTNVANITNNGSIIGYTVENINA